MFEIVPLKTVRKIKTLWTKKMWKKWQNQKNSYYLIMLQKLSKCEVKAWLCWKLFILPPLSDFMWNYILGNSNISLCSRNFQNVKLRLDFIEIWWFYRHSEFGWNHILANSNSPKMSFLAIQEVLNFDFSKFQVPNIQKFKFKSL